LGREILFEPDAPINVGTARSVLECVVPDLGEHFEEALGCGIGFVGIVYGDANEYVELCGFSWTFFGNACGGI